MSDAMFLQIEAKRMAMDLSIDALASAAGVTPRTYQRIKAGQQNAFPATLGKLNTALKRLGTAFGGEAGALAPHAAYKACLVIAAFELKADAFAALNADPGRRATANAAWMEAAEVRQLGLTIACQFLGFRIADLARAAGMTKQAVSAALRAIEWERDPEGGDNRDLDRIFCNLERVFFS